jgi:hypothetical protein
MSTDDAKAARWAELLAHWRANGPPGVLRAGYRTATQERPVLHERTGERVGRHVDHWSGRVDAHAEKFETVVNPHALPTKETE